LRLTGVTVDEYIKNMRRNDWGDDDTAFAAAQAFGVAIRVITSAGLDYTYKPATAENVSEIVVGYESAHYYCLVPAVSSACPTEQNSQIIPVVVGAFGTIPKNLPDNLSKLGIPDVVGGLQTTALLGTRRLLKNALSL
jgi:methylmalonyl-CoA mutase cobalamin-binding subunit